MSTAPTVVFLGKGRLGNQVFQWVALRKHFPGSRVWAPTLAALPRVLETGDALRVTLPHAWLDRLLRRKLGRLTMRVLFKHGRLGGYAHEPVERLPDDSESATGRFVVRGGDRALVFVDGGYFQNIESLLLPTDFQVLRIHPTLLARARSAIGRAVAGAPWPHAVMHVRRTDYLHYRPFGLSDVTLPAAYYIRASARLRQERGPRAPLLIVTDDAPWCHAELAALQPFHVMSSTEAVDFAALSMFPAVAVSNSSFSLAAACISREVQQVVAPEFWFGARVGRWYPEHMRSADRRFTYL